MSSIDPTQSQGERKSGFEWGALKALAPYLWPAGSTERLNR